jgi:radical SAM superfamily enzyme
MSRSPFVDACFINESEEAFIQFITKLSETNFNYSKTDFTGITGISYRFAGKVYTNPENPVLRHNSGTVDRLDKYPSPYLSGVIPGTEGYNAGILTARGCNQNCVYCNCAILSNRRFSTHSVDRVIEELDFISKQLESTQVITFQDDAFTLIPQRATKICNAIINNKINARFGCITRCDCVDESLLDLMKAAGFVSIAFSLESANPETLRRIGKVNVAEDTPSHGFQKEIKFIESLDRMTAYAKKIGIKNVVASVMVGLPGETLGEARRTIEAIEKNMSIDKYAHNFLAIFKGTPLFSNYKKYGYGIRYINNNPIFPKVTYPVDVISKVQISPKSNMHSLKEYNDKSTLKILSLTCKERKAKAGFTNIILQSDQIKGMFVRWLKDILTINGTIIQIYSDPESMTRLADRNYEMLIKYLSPSLNIRNYCLERDDDGLNLISSTSILLKSDRTNDSIRICDFEFVKLNLADHSVNFTRTLCKEVNSRDTASVYSYLETISKKKDPFSYLINQNALPYFANICKWTKELSNCTSRNTLIVNNKSEVRLCWCGTVIGEVGQSYDELIDNFESELNEIMSRRQCSICMVKSSCIKCPCPSPPVGKGLLQK